MKSNMDKSNIICERLMFFIKYIGLSVSDFAFSCGIKETDIYTVSTGREMIVHRICSAYPRLNPAWLHTGRGNMERVKQLSSTKDSKVELKNDKLIQIIRHKDTQISRLLNLIEERDKMLSKLIDNL